MQPTPSSTSRASLLRRLFILDGKLHPLWRVVLYLVLLFSGSFALQVGMGIVYVFVRIILGSAPSDVIAELSSGRIPGVLWFALTLAGLVWALAQTWVFRRWLDKAPMRGLGFARGAFWKEVVAGLGLGLASMGVILVVHLVLGWAEFTRMTTGAALGSLVSTALVLIPAAATEEITFRGYLLQTLEGWRGWGLGVTASSVLFGLAHGLNPNVSALPLANIALAGVVFCLAYRITRRLWMVIAYHFMWNYAQGPLFGFPVSGQGFEALTKATVTGPALWTGGAFGPEGGLLVTVLLIMTGVGLWWIGTRMHTDRHG
jgi:CAAX protease family protein